MKTFTFSPFVFTPKAVLTVLGCVATFLVARGYISRDESAALAAAIMALLGVFNPNHRDDVIVPDGTVGTVGTGVTVEAKTE